MAQLRPKIVKLAKIIGGVTGITTKIDENAPEYYCMAGILTARLLHANLESAHCLP